MSADLVAFLRACLDDDESAALGAKGTTLGRWQQDDGPPEDIVLYDKSGKLTMGQARHIARHDPKRTLAEIAVDRGLLADYERLLRANQAHKAAAAELAADIEHEERTGRWAGAGLPDVRQRALRREADYLPGMLLVLETWAKAKAAVYAGSGGFRPEWAP